MTNCDKSLRLQIRTKFERSRFKLSRDMDFKMWLSSFVFISSFRTLKKTAINTNAIFDCLEIWHVEEGYKKAYLDAKCS